MKLTAAGDALIQKNIPSSYQGLQEIKAYLSQGDARFFNLETSISEKGECFASQFSGGTYLRISKDVFNDLRSFDFNMTNINHNHIMDFSYQGFCSTLQAVDESGLVHAGVGYSLIEASSPSYLKTENGTVALISVNTSFDPTMMAGKPTKQMKGRPGINGLRTQTTYTLLPEEMKLIKEIAHKTGANRLRENRIKEGYDIKDKDEIAYFADMKFTEAQQEGMITTIMEEDLQRVKEAILSAKKQANEILISLHTHQIENEKESVPEFIKDFAHFCIDQGATAIIGHGPHLLRAIEVYRDHPIFYSLGDFILQLYDVEYAPADFYEKYGVDPNEPVYELLKKRSKNFTIGLMEDEKMSQSVLPFWKTENGKLVYLELLPIQMSMHEDKEIEGLPFIAKDPSFIEKLNLLSKPYGVRVELENGKYICRW